MEITKITKNAFAIMAVCEETKRPYGIVVEPVEGGGRFIWSFKISEAQAQREGYDEHHVQGGAEVDEHFNGCPHCGTKMFYFCQNCGKIVCWHGQERVTCPSCGASGTLRKTESIDLKGGGI